MDESFEEIRRSVSSIHVFKPTKGKDPARATDLVSSRFDDRTYRVRRRGHDFIGGDGSKLNPYTYKGAASVSPYYAIIDLWMEFRDRARAAGAPPIFIKVNDWVLQIGPEGVTAEDGHFSKLL